MGEKIHDLEVWGVLSKEKAKRLKKISRSRNKFLHELEPVDTQLLKETFYVAFEAAQIQFNKIIGLEFDIDIE